MGTKTSTLAIKIVSDAKDAGKGFDDADDKVGRLSGTLAKAGAAFAVAGAGVVAIGKQAFDAASDLQQSTGAIDAVFGDWSVDIEQAAQQASKAVGLSTSDYENMAAVIGAQLGNAGMAHDEMNDKTQALIKTGADMAAIFGGTATDAVDALSSALKGEMDPIERYGVSLNQAAIQQQMAADGTDKLTGAAAKQAQTNAILELITKQTASTQGAWAEQTGTAAEAQQILGAKLENLKAALGERLLPIFAAVASFISDKVIPYFGTLTEKGGPLSDMFDKVGKIIGENVIPVVKDVAKFVVENVIPAWQDIARNLTDVAIPAFKGVWDFIDKYIVPILKTILPPIISGVQGFFKDLATALKDNSDKFSNIYENLKPLLDFLRDKVAPFVGGTLKLAFEGLGTVLGKVVDLISFVLDKASSVIGFIGKIVGAGGDGDGPAFGVGRVATAYGAGTASLRGASALPASLAVMAGLVAGPAAAGLPAGDTINITVNGALDAMSVADQLSDMLAERDRQTGRTSTMTWSTS